MSQQVLGSGKSRHKMTAAQADRIMKKHPTEAKIAGAILKLIDPKASKGFHRTIGKSNTTTAALLSAFNTATGVHAIKATKSNAKLNAHPAAIKLAKTNIAKQGRKEADQKAGKSNTPKVKAQGIKSKNTSSQLEL